MANESQFITTAKINPQKFDFTIVGTGGTLTSSNVLEVSVLKTAFTAPEGKIRLLNALEALRQKIIETNWPVA